MGDLRGQLCREARGNRRQHWTWKLLNGLDHLLWASLEGDIPGIFHWRVRGTGRAGRNRVECCELVAGQNEFPELLQGYPLRWIRFKDPAQDGIQLSGQRKNGLQEVPVSHVRSESGIIKACPFPRIAATGEIYQYDTKRPHIIGC